MDFLAIILSLMFVLTLFQAINTTLSNRSISKSNLPPGPNPLPIIGNLHLLGTQPHKSLTKLAKINGPIMTLKLGHVISIVISSPHLAKQVLIDQDLAFSGTRFIPDALRAHDHHNYSLSFIPISPRWRTLRRIVNSNIFSITRLDASQHVRLTKVNELVEYCRGNSQNNEPVNVNRAAFRTTLNLLSNINFSKDLTDPYSDSGKEFREMISNIMVEIGKPNLVDYFPMLGKLDIQGIRRRMTAYFGEVLKLLDGLINERLEQKDKLEGVVKSVDVLDVLLSTSQENPQQFDQSRIKRLCLDLFVAGTDTTSNTLEWTMAELFKNPKVMEKAKKELAQVIGKRKVIKETDIDRLPYLRCIVKETLRLHPLVPFLLPRKLEQDVEIHGYIIPQGSQILVNAWAIGRDSNIWENSLAFEPERFLNSEVDVKGQDFELIPFGAGRRICPELPLVIRIIPLMLGSLLNSFDWKLPEEMTADQLDMEERFGLTLEKAQPLKAIPISL